MAEAVRYSDSLTIRCQPGITELVERAALKRGTKPSEWHRQAVLSALQDDGFDLASIASRDAGALYNLVAGLRHWALVADGAVKATHRSADKPEDEQGGVWLLIDYEDSEPFHADRHWRLPYETTVEACRVVRTYPVVAQEAV
jgi:hypothetical protein